MLKVPYAHIYFSFGGTNSRITVPYRRPVHVVRTMDGRSTDSRDITLLPTEDHMNARRLCGLVHRANTGRV